MRSFATASSFEPSSKKGWFETPNGERLAVTNRLALTGFAPGVTLTNSTIWSPGLTASGLDDPMPVGAVDAFACVLRGFGAAAAKSVELLSVSAAPPAPRRTAVVFDGAGVGAGPSKQFAVVPKPTKSTSDGVAVIGHPIVSAVVVESSATFP